MIRNPIHDSLTQPMVLPGRYFGRFLSCRQDAPICLLVQEGIDEMTYPKHTIVDRMLAVDILNHIHGHVVPLLSNVKPLRSLNNVSTVFQTPNPVQ